MEDENEDQQECEYCGTTENVFFGPDPYLLEIYNDDTDKWLCEDCIKKRQDDI